MSEVDRYDYQLPKELIAQHPLANRTDSRLMVVDRDQGTITHSHVRDLLEFVQPHDCLVFNDTRVIPAKLVGNKAGTGGKWQGLFLDSDEQGVGKLLCKTRGSIQAGDEVVLRDRKNQEDIKLVMLARLSGGAWAVRPEPAEDWQALLERVGRVPLPHYIRDGIMVDADLKNYQTVYAKYPGAVAAPTAGLHFNKQLLMNVQAAGVEISQVTLHVGIGTFRPIKVERLLDHEMHFESGEIKPPAVQTINESRENGGRVIAVGTTSVRVLETASAEGALKPWAGETNLFITEGYRFCAVDCLLTNFHLPRSTLLILVRAFGGEELVKRAYQEAIEQEYRFFSYGDAMLIV